jgi:hypothetical protein
MSPVATPTLAGDSTGLRYAVRPSALRSAWLAAAGSSPRRHVGICSFERNRQSVRPLRAATAETEGVIGYESLLLIASSQAQYLTVTNESPSVDQSGRRRLSN